MAPMRTLLLLCLLAAPALAAPAKGPPPEVVEALLARAELEAVLERGPQRFIASIRVRPHLEDGRFRGFQLVGMTPEAPFVNSPHIRPGDVVLAVNREPIERPEQFMRAWELLGRADALEVLVQRDGRRVLYRWTLKP